jgi:acetyl esterase
LTGLPALERVEDLRLPVTGGEIGLRLYRPQPAPPAIIVWAHGGGFVLGSIDEIDNFARALAEDSGCAVVSVEYRLAPEHPFPTAVNDLSQAAIWVCEQAARLAGNPVPVVLGGDSAGANLATVVTRKLHESGGCAIARNVLAYPNTDSPDAASLRRFEPPFLGLCEIEFFLGLYNPDPALHRHPDFAPLHAPGLDLLPPTLIITAEHDILTEQAETYGEALAANGVEVSTIRYPGMIHGFLTMDAFVAGAARSAIGEIREFLRGLGDP